jgi:hypothetical protein
MNKNKLKRALDSAEKSAEAIQDLCNLIMKLQLDDEELGIIINIYNRLESESEVTIKQLSDIIEAHELND